MAQESEGKIHNKNRNLVNYVKLGIKLSNTHSQSCFDILSKFRINNDIQYIRIIKNKIIESELMNKIEGSVNE